MYKLFSAILLSGNAFAAFEVTGTSGGSCHDDYGRVKLAREDSQRHADSLCYMEGLKARRISSFEESSQTKTITCRIYTHKEEVQVNRIDSSAMYICLSPRGK